MAKEELHPTHRHNPEKGWQRFNEVTASYMAVKDPNPQMKLVRLDESRGWTYYADRARQPHRTYTFENVAITDEERKVLVKLAQDYQAYLRLVTNIEPELDLAKYLQICLAQLKSLLDNGYWVQPFEEGKA